jgi:hypothetical protein
MDVQDLAPALLAMAEIAKIANQKLNGDRASIKVLVNADIEHKCFQLDLSLSSKGPRNSCRGGGYGILRGSYDAALTQRERRRTDFENDRSHGTDENAAVDGAAYLDAIPHGDDWGGGDCRDHLAHSHLIPADK